MPACLQPSVTTPLGEGVPRSFGAVAAHKEAPRIIPGTSACTWTEKADMGGK